MTQQSDEIELDIILGAVHGKESAIEEILQVYDAYITTISTFQFFDKEGRLIRKVDEDMKVQIQQRLVEAIKKWRIMI